MKIWLDVLTPKQILFFHPLAEELTARGHQVKATSRHYREVPPLAEKVGLRLQYIGSHGGPALYDKLKASSERTTALAGIIRNWKPDFALSFSSPECARVSFGLGLKHICINDSPHAESVARLTIPLSGLLLTPWIIPKSAWIKYGIGNQKIIHYRALDPAAWLKRRKAIDVDASDIGVDPSKPTILVRLEERYASYLQSYNGSSTAKLLEQLCALSKFNIVVLCRYELQLQSITEKYGSKFVVPSDIVDGAALISVSDVFVGMGGTMTAEAALLGVPTISAYPGGLIYTEKYLVNKGLLVRPRSITGVVKAVEYLLKDQKRRVWLKNRAKNILGSMDDPIQRIVSVVEGLP